MYNLIRRRSGEYSANTSVVTTRTHLEAIPKPSTSNNANADYQDRQSMPSLSSC